VSRGKPEAVCQARVVTGKKGGGNSMSNTKNQEAVIFEHLENLDDLRYIEETKKQELNSALLASL
jgi:hypothetical protein